jgi:hypothetical protein
LSDGYFAAGVVVGAGGLGVGGANFGLTAVGEVVGAPEVDKSTVGDIENSVSEA